MIVTKWQRRKCSWVGIISVRPQQQLLVTLEPTRSSQMWDVRLRHFFLIWICKTPVLLDENDRIKAEIWEKLLNRMYMDWRGCPVREIYSALPQIHTPPPTIPPTPHYTTHPPTIPLDNTIRIHTPLPLLLPPAHHCSMYVPPHVIMCTSWLHILHRISLIFSHLFWILLTYTSCSGS